MKIAILDDKTEELERAKKAVESKGHGAMSIHLKSTEGITLWELLPQLDEVDCVITDLMFNPLMGRGFARGEYYEKNIPPAGLLVVIYALAKEKVVVICTDASEIDGADGHHGKAIGWIFDGFFKKNYSLLEAGATKDMLPLPVVGWEEDKNWTKAVEIAEKLCK